MRSTTFAAVLSFAASALAYQVTFPTATQGWTVTGPNKLTWTRVSTDATNFTALLTNQDRSILPTDEVLVAYVDGTTGTVTVNAPSNSFPVGGGFQVNLVQDTTHLSTIYAQSNQFNITQSTASVSSTSTGVTTPPIASTLTVPPTATGVTPGGLNPTTSDTTTQPTTTSGALPAAGMNLALMGVAAVLVGVFA